VRTSAAVSVVGVVVGAPVVVCDVYIVVGTPDVDVVVGTSVAVCVVYIVVTGTSAVVCAV
jgi:hypothetical protein